MTRAAAAQILAEDSEDLMGGFGYKPKVDQAGLLVEKKDNDGGSVAADVSNDLVSAADKFGVGNLSEGIGGTSVLDSGVDGGGVFGGSSHVQVARDGMGSDGDLSCTDKDGKRRKESARIVNQNADVNRDGMGLGLGRWNGERLEDQSHGFRVGDLVWGKIKGHPWWPGQVYDPRDASDFALKHSREGCVLVAFFGDRSCSWCLPSQLLPFVENLDEQLRENSSKSFQTAVHMALNEICRVMESKILCKCIPPERRDHLARPKASNAGVRTGVLVPEVGIDRLPIPEYKPAELLAKVTDFARSGLFDGVFEHAVLRSWVSAYYLWKWGSKLHVYSEPRLIEGMEERRETPITFFGPITVRSQGPKNQKQRAVTELMGSMHIVKRSAVKEGADDREGGQSSGKTSRKRRDDDTSDENEVATAGNTWVEAKEESEFVSTPRERKKSKYLSPPYTSHPGRTGLKDYKPESKSDELMVNSSGTSHDLSASPAYESDDSDDKTSIRKKMTFSVSDVDVEVNEMLQKLQVAAADCRYLRKEGHLDSVWGFISAHRSSTFLHGEDYKVYHKYNRVSQKRKPLRLKARGPAEEPAQLTDDLVSDARVMRQKLDVMTATLENYCSRFSSDDKSCLKKDMEHLMENVEATGEKVQAIAAKHHLE